MLSDDSEDDGESKEEEEIKKEETKAKGDVAISVEVPDEAFVRKRKKKGFDMEAYVKRELSRAERELQMLKHKSHVMCLIGHLKFVNSHLGFPPQDHPSAQVSLATALSIIPQVRQ